MILGKKRQMNLAQGPGMGGLGSGGSSRDSGRGSRLWGGVETVVVATWSQHLGEEQRSGPCLAASAPARLPPDGAVPAAGAQAAGHAAGRETRISPKAGTGATIPRFGRGREAYEHTAQGLRLCST